MHWCMVAMSPKATTWMASLMSGWVQRSTSAVCGEIGGNSCLASWLAIERQKDGGLLVVLMMVCGRWVAAALVKVGRHSLRMATSPRRLSFSLETDNWQEEVGDLLDRLTDI